ncbi:MAG: endonuclease [Urechidicola sp.]|nr:endonuclease [Urechidicola sp.]
MKKLLLLSLIITSFNVIAQIPADYYDTATGSGYTLKTQLRDIVTAGHSANTYDDLYTGYVSTHSDDIAVAGYENDGSILDMYSENPAGSDPYNYTHFNNQCGNQSAEGDCYNREHLVPQSSFNSNFPMQSDIHHVVPSDVRVNNFRGSLAFGNVATADWTSLNGSLRGSSAMAGYNGTVFEPIDEFKGDIARALLYFAVRYENTVDGYTSFVMFNGSNDQVFFDWAITVLLEWHAADPVSQHEINRNTAAYNYQGNANPFVDHPEYAAMIWNPTPDTENPTAPTNLVASNPTSSTVDLTWTASTDNVAVTSYDIYVDNVNTYNTSNTSYTAIGLAADTNFCFTVYAKDGAGNTSTVSNEDCATTLAGGSSGPELFFSEYVEGGSFNKILEVANFTGSSVDLSTYTLKRANNGAAAWETTYSFPVSSSINDQDVYVIANGANAICTGEVDDLNNDITSFNGNDVLGLFKNDVLIDIIGVLGDGADFAQNTTLVRKPTINGPNTSFDIAEWGSFAQDTCTDIGSHSVTLAVNDYTLESIRIYPNPASGNTLTIEVLENVTISVFDILGKQVLNTQVSRTNNQIDISDLNSGIYMIRLQTENGSATKKLIKK